VNKPAKATFKDHKWRYSYKTSAAGPDGQPTDILQEFYIPALKMSARYDRVAGYFRSSSLAAASQGFSAFTEAGGRMRLIVGADLNPADVAAILMGNRQLMADRLNAEFGESAKWPADVRRGVDLLCWMVAQDVLEVRVAFRVNAQTGDPIPFLSVEDGYVHEKWAVFTDSAGNRLYISGSLNESQKALLKNAENIDVHAEWWGDIECRRVDEAEAVFDLLWTDQNPHLRVLSLPEAVQEKMIKIGKSAKQLREIDGSSARPPAVSPASAKERLAFALIKDGPHLPGGRFVGMETAPLKSWPHQEVVARRLIETWPYSYMLCDEVGLGKTIEAGLAIRSLVLSNIAKRVLIAPPASLTRQWQREMAAKFFLPFARTSTRGGMKHEMLFPFEESISGQALYAPDLNIVSTGLLSRGDRQTELRTAAHFDIILIDEAHYARRKQPKNGEKTHARFGNLYRTIIDPLRRKGSSLWLATATPMQLDWIEAFDLQALTGRVGSFQMDPSLFLAFYQVLGSLVRGSDIDAGQWDLLKEAIARIQRQDPFLWRYLERSVIDGRIRNATRLWLERGIRPRGTDRNTIRRLIFAAAPLSRVMLRHGRELLEIYREKDQLDDNLARRNISAMPRIVLTGLEKQAYDALESYCKDLTDKISDNVVGKKWKDSLGLYLSFLRLRLASSLFAIRETLKRRREKVIETLRYHRENVPMPADIESEADVPADEEPDQKVLDNILSNRTEEDLLWEKQRLEQMLLPLEDLSTMPLKMKELLRVLNERRIKPGDRIAQTVVFTRFYDTLQDIVKRLRQINPAMLIGTYSGRGGQYVDPVSQQIKGVERDEIKHRFLRGEIDVLICTDAAAEGLNLQTADLLINYDLPWNPMKVEQRIGRIDRIGQKHSEIHVLNLCYADSAEQIVYERLLQRLVQAHYIVGTQQVSMLPVTRDEFNALAARTLSPEVLEKRAEERIQEQQQRTRSMEIVAKDLYEIYMRMKARQDSETAPVTLQAIWRSLAESDFLRDCGCILMGEKTDQTLTIRGLADIQDGTELTINRDLYEKGLIDAGGPLHFASYGDPVFEKILHFINDFDLPDCVERLTENVGDGDVKIMAYAVACLDTDGSPDLRLITNLNALDDLRLDEGRTLEETDLVSIKNHFHDRVRTEFEPMLAVPRIEKDNQRAAHAQSIFELLIAQSIFTPPNIEDSDHFSQAVKDLYKLTAERHQLMVPRMPVQVLRQIHADLLIKLPLPNVGEEISPTLPIVFIRSALDAASRLADSMKKAKAQITVAEVKRRIERELGKLMKNIS